VKATGPGGDRADKRLNMWCAWIAASPRRASMAFGNLCRALDALWRDQGRGALQTAYAAAWHDPD